MSSLKNRRKERAIRRRIALHLREFDIVETPSIEMSNTMLDFIEEPELVFDLEDEPSLKTIYPEY